MITPDTSMVAEPDPVESVSPEQIDSYLSAKAGQAGLRVVPYTGLGAVYCGLGKVYKLRPEILIAQGTQEVYFYANHPKNSNWIDRNNPGEMKYYQGRFDPEDAPPQLNRAGAFATFASKRRGVKAHFELARQYVDQGNVTVRQFLRAWGTGMVDTVVERANAILARPKIPGDGVRSDFTARATHQLASRGYARGYRGGVMRTEWPLSRAEMAVLIVRFFPDKFLGISLSPVPPDTQGHWAQVEIGKVISAGYMRGFPDGTWRPDEFLTRAQTCAILRRIAAPPVLEREARTFADVPPNAWFADDVAWAYANGWLEEFSEQDVYGNPRFLPDLPITRGEMFHLSYNLLKQIGTVAGRRWPRTAGPGGQFTSAIWVAKDDLWVPRSAAVFVSEDETFDMPFTVVPVEEAARPRWPWILGSATAAGLAAYLLFRKRM